MTPKQRLLAAIKGEDKDRIPWSPFLAYFWESQPEEIRAAGQLKFMEDIGADPLLRGFNCLFKIYRDRCTVSEKVEGNDKFIMYDTPVGKLRERYIYVKKANTWFLTEHPIKTQEDFKVLTYINENMRVEPYLDDFQVKYEKMGERCLIVPIIGTELKTSFQSLVEHWVGTEELVYALEDYPETVEECIHAMRRNALDSARISVQSPAEAFIFWEDSSTTNISPSYFEKYAMPEIIEWSKILHREGKLLIHHACGHIRALIPYMAKAGIDIIESISPPPTGNIEIWEAGEMLPDNIGLIGGIEPTVFLNSSLQELEIYVEELLTRMKGKRFVLANSDSCPPGVSLEKFKLVSEIVRRTC